MERIIVGADHAGFRLKESILAHLKARNIPFEDVGCYDENSVDYPAISAKVVEKMAEYPSNPGNIRGIICCGSGIGVTIAANRYGHVRAVEAHDHNTAILSRRHNNTNVLCLGGRVIALPLACDLIDIWLATPFDGGRHEKRVEMMSEMASSRLSGQEEAPLC